MLGAVLGFLLGRTAEARWITVLFALIFVIVDVGVQGWELRLNSRQPPWIPKGHDQNLWLASLTSVLCTGLLAYGLIRRFAWTQTRRFQLGIKISMSVLVLVAGIFYFHGSRAKTDSYYHRGDTYHYYMGAKYFDEVGYWDLYECTVKALGKNRFKNKDTTRNLRTYQMVNVARVLESGPDCLDRFSPERWEQFKSDLDLWAQTRVRMRKMVTDHGYNGTPVQAFFAGKLANLIPVSEGNMAKATLIDVFLICLMMVVVSRAFGWKLGLVFAVFYFTNVVDRYMIIGASFLRFSWMFALGTGIAALKLRKHGWAGALLSTAALLNVFPALFVFAALVHHGWESFRQRRVSRGARRFVLAAALTTAGLGALGAAHGKGLQNYGEFAVNMELHTADRLNQKGDLILRQSGFGVGLKYAFLYRGDHNKASMKAPFSRKKKTEQYAQVKHVHLGAAALLIGAVLLLGRKLDAVETTTLLGFTIMFCLLDTAGYYFTVSCVLVLLWHARARDGPGYLFLFGLIAANVVGHLYLQWGDSHRYVLLNSVMTFSWLFYLLAAISAFCVWTGLFRTWANALVPKAAKSDGPPAAPSTEE
jgi:hypothetical protein